MSDDNTTIEPQNYLYGLNVVQLDGIRIARGKSKREYEKCPHLHMVIDDQERRVFCQDCQKTITAFDGLMSLFGNWGKIVGNLDKRQEQVKSAETYSLRRIVTKKLDEEWSKHSTVPCCPHCEEGLLPEDLIGRIKHKSKEMVIAKRKKQREPS